MRVSVSTLNADTNNQTSIENSQNTAKLQTRQKLDNDKHANTTKLHDKPANMKKLHNDKLNLKSELSIVF